MTKIDFVFFGTDEFAVGVLNQLRAAGLTPTLIITTPDKPQGRKLILTPPPVKIWAEKSKIDFLQPDKLRTDAKLSQELSVSSYQLFVVASYGKIIPQNILNLPAHGTLNVHPSLLPKYRGPAPIQSVILNGAEETGVSIMLLDEQVDHGPVLKTGSYRPENENYPALRDKLAELGGKLLAEVMPNWLAGKIKPAEQDHTQATFTKMIKKEDGLVALEDISQKPAEIYRKFLAYQPWPGIYFFTQNKTRVKITDCVLESGRLEIKKVIPAGGKEMTWEDYRRGQTI